MGGASRQFHLGHMLGLPALEPVRSMRGFLECPELDSAASQWFSFVFACSWSLFSATTPRCVACRSARFARKAQRGIVTMVAESFVKKLPLFLSGCGFFKSTCCSSACA